MSNTTKEVEQECDLADHCGAISLVIQPRDKDLGGFTVRRTLPTAHCEMIGPWIFFDHMGPARFKPGEGINVRPHPHIGIATVTYLFEGEILHRDSLGSLQAIRPGDINLMIAGKGIVHSERERPERKETHRTLHGLQLWLALPLEDEEINPAFYHYPAAEIPTVTVDGVSVRVMIGSAYGVVSPVKTYSETIYIEARMQKGQRLVLPEADELGVYIANGHLQAKDTQLPAHSMAVISAQDNAIEVIASEDSTITVIGGKNIGKRYIEWNFVSSRKERIEQAKLDWKNGNYPKVIGDEIEFIPLPE